jgi:translation initiation factor 3 subunit I
VCAFPYTPGQILTGHESGKVALFDALSGDELLSNERAHMDVVTDLQLSPDRSYFITSSKDKTARIHDARTLTVLKTFQTETPLNSAALAPNMPYVRPPPVPFRPPRLRLRFSIEGPARWRSGSHERHDDVITTGQVRGPLLASHLRRGSRSRQGTLWSAEHVRRHKHPLFFFFFSHGSSATRIAVHPAGTAYASGGEDGFVRVHHFDESYFKARPYGEVEILN